MSDLTFYVTTHQNAKLTQPTASLKFQDGKLWQAWQIEETDERGRIISHSVEYRLVEGQDP